MKELNQELEIVQLEERLEMVAPLKCDSATA